MKFQIAFLFGLVAFSQAANAETLVQKFNLGQATVVPKGCEPFYNFNCIKECAVAGNYQVEIPYKVIDVAGHAVWNGSSETLNFCGAKLKFFVMGPDTMAVLLQEGSHSMILQSVKPGQFSPFNYVYGDSEGGSIQLRFEEYDPRLPTQALPK